MKTKTIRTVLASLAGCLTLGAMAADPAVSDVVVRQRWPWSRLVDIDYVLTCDASQRVDVAVTASDGSTALALPSGSLTGDLYCVAPGAARIVWDPSKTAYTNKILTQFSVTLAPTAPPLYMIVDLTKAAGADGQTAYVYESDLTNGLWGAWVRNPVTNSGTVVESVVWTGVTTNDSYKTDKLVLRRIRAGTFGMGSSASFSTSLTKDFYAGVFEVTQYQWVMLMGSNPSDHDEGPARRPVEEMTYNAIRGATTNTPTINWPTTGFEVLPSSFVGRLRAATGIADFDLPTEAQWEYFCRAGTTTMYNDGEAAANVSGNNATSNVWLDVLGRYIYNASSTGAPDYGTALVGCYLPNAWGVYDTHGNVREYCLDWEASLAGGEDPKGPDSGTYRINRGGSWNRIAASATCADRTSIQKLPGDHNGNVGFRIVRHLQ